MCSAPGAGLEGSCMVPWDLFCPPPPLIYHGLKGLGEMWVLPMGPLLLLLPKTCRSHGTGVPSPAPLARQPSALKTGAKG